MRLSSKQMAYWLQQAKTNIICPSLVILPPSVTHSWAIPALLFSICSLLIVLFSPTRSTNILTNWLNGPIFPPQVSIESCPLHPLTRDHAEEICLYSCPVSGHPDSYTVPQGSQSHCSPGLVILCRPPFPIPTIVFCISLLLIFPTLPFITCSVTVSIKSLSTNARLVVRFGTH